MMKKCFVLFLYLAFSLSALANPLIYKAGGENKKNKQIVLIASDHEYRSEETLPALARILSVHHGFDCTVLFGLNEQGEVTPGASNIPGMEALEKADGLVLFARFLDLPDAQMKHLDTYLNRGGPVVSLRTTTHAFKIKQNATYYKYHFAYKGEDYKGGFGKQVLGQSWVGHYGQNHVQSTRISLVPEQASNPILRGVKDVHVHAGGYNAVAQDDWTILSMAQPLMSMEVDGKPDASKRPMASEWTRDYAAKDGKKGRVFTSLYGASEDILNNGYRRMLVNGVYWSLGLENQIDGASKIDFVGPYRPTTFFTGGGMSKVKPAMYQDLSSPIPAEGVLLLMKKKPAKKLGKKSETKKPVAKPEGKVEASQVSTEKVFTKNPARFVRIRLKGKATLTLAEVEVMVAGKNIAKAGKATQAKTAHGGVASRAVDGNKSPKYGAGGQTHTANDMMEPWWELDLGSDVNIEEVAIWNRGEGFSQRLNGFFVELLDSNRKQTFFLGPNAAIDGVMRVNTLTGEYLVKSHDGKPEKAAKYKKATKQAPKPGLIPMLPVQPAVAVPADLRDPSPFAFGNSDRVAIIGNALGERFQRKGDIEVYLQSLLKGKQVSFRNMCLSGDLVDQFPRSSGFAGLDAHLQKVKADVIFCFFGYNESYDNNPAQYKGRLLKLVKNLRSYKPNGTSFPRIVLFSPIAHEDLKDRNLPGGKENNVRLQAYTQATQEAAKEAGVTFVDLFTISQKYYDVEDDALTINGIHLNERGSDLLGRFIAEQLTGEKAPTRDTLKMLDVAVEDKNWHWFNRYRAADGNDVWGSRSKLSFVDGQRNREVLLHELSMIDTLVANRDKRVWANAKGESFEVDDANMPKAIPVISNVGGGSRSSSATKEGSVNYISGEEGVSKLKMPEGYKVNLFADEKMFPELVNPVQLQVDTKGRLWAAVWPTYPKWEPGKEMNDALVIFEDSDGDGKADKRKVFAYVNNPVGFEFWNGGVLVTCSPNVLFLKDTDGDDVADVRYVMLHGLGTSDTHHSANNFIFGPDGGIYWQSGVFLKNSHEHPWGKALTTGASGMYRFDPRRFTIAFHAGNGPNPHGIAFDNWGYHYANDGTSGRAYQVRPEGNGFKMHPLLNKTVRPVPADCIVSSAHLPDELEGNFLIANSIGFLGLKNYKLHRDGYTKKERNKEIHYKVGEVWGTAEPDLLKSSDGNFRPTDAIVGADGALYVSDWSNVIIGHMQHNVRDPNRDHKHGRIYRVTYPSRPLQEAVKIDGEPIANLLKNLEHPVEGVRHRTRVELSERKTKEVIKEVKLWLKTLDASKPEHARHFLEALWVHQQHNVRNHSLLDIVLASPVEHARINAATVKQHWGVADPGNGPLEIVEMEEEKHEFVVPKHLKGDDAVAYKAGGEVYHREAHCATCHQADGKGMANIFPPLSGSKWVTGDKERLIKIALHGLTGSIEVKGVSYPSAPPMTAFRDLIEDEDMAAVLTYVRNSWGNKAGSITAPEVSAVRLATKEQTIFWNAEELLKVHPMEE